MLYLRIFWVFFRISLISFGGVFGILNELQRSVVQSGWIGNQQFVQDFIVAQFVPGPNMALCPLIGYSAGGPAGWLAGFLGIYAAPMLIMAIAIRYYGRYRENAYVRRVELSLRPLVFGLISASGISLFLQVASGHLVLAGALGAVGTLAYASRKLGSLTTITLVGILWWACLSGAPH